eukprot:scaffold50280_cov53-Phaeocystis_antarctica.AAC.2
MHAASHTYSRRVALLAYLALPARRQGSLLRCLHHTYSRRLHCPPATPRLRRQGSLLRCMPHHTPTFA